MDTSSFSALLNNIILLLALGVIYDTLGLHAIKHKLARDGLSGLLAGIIGLAVMSMSWEMQPGIFFDTRWVLLSLCGLFFGFRPTLIAVVITVSYRLYQGGSGIFVGSLVIILSSCAGLLWRCWSKKAQRPLSWLMLYLFGMQVQVIVLLCMFLMPAEIRWPIITAIAPSLLLAYPVATMVLGLILRRQRDRRAAEKALRKSQEELNRERGLLRGLVDAIPDLIFVKNTQSEYKGCNKAFEAFSNHTESEVQGKTDMELFSPEVSVLVREKDQAVLSTGLPQSYECVSAYPDGREVVLDVYKAPFYGLDGTLYGIVGISRDITDKRAADELIWQQANFDTLTGLPNRNMMQDRMAQEIKKAHRVGGMVALMFLDLDRFKEINDSLGHDMGDRLLVEAARRLSLAVRDTDTVARQGGDEFTVILGELKETGSVEKVANNILTSLAEPFLLGDEQVYVTASIGITFYPDDATEIEALLKNADQAMYAAKAAGRNRFSYFTAAMQEAALTRVQLAKDLRTALSGGQFRVDYQPIVALNTGSVYKAEALIRWQHPTLGLVSPVDFIGVAEDTGQIVDIGQWVFEYAAKQVLEWRKTIHPDFQISVNTSPVQFCEESCKPSAWIQALEALGLPGQGISVEITEGLLMDTGKVVSEKLLAFRDGNIQVSLDDFGTGYSSLAYLRRFDIDYLKIDKAFVSNLEIDSDDMVLCEAIIVMAHKLGIKVIAEGIETAEQHGLLAAAGCDYGQGYYFSRPVSAGQFAR
ncbi:MAG: EAL domain-containing protein, partial [Pontibacterium sp.]